MAATLARVQYSARVILAASRLVNGGVALAAPGFMARRLGIDPRANPAALYALRMFGVRTIVVGLDLLRRDEAVRTRALRVAVFIHASDALAGALAWQAGAPAAPALISTFNTILAGVARGAVREPRVDGTALGRSDAD